MHQDYKKDRSQLLRTTFGEENHKKANQCNLAKGCDKYKQNTERQIIQTIKKHRELH